MKRVTSPGLLVVALLGGCRGGTPPPAKPAPATATAPSAPTALSLPPAAPASDPRLPEEHPGLLPVRVAGCDRGPAFETLALEVAEDPIYYWGSEDVIDFPEGGAVGVISRVSLANIRTIYVRRALSDAGRSVPGDVYLAGSPEGRPGAHYRFEVPSNVKPCAKRPEIETAYFKALAGRFDSPRSAFATFAEAWLSRRAFDPDRVGGGTYGVDRLVVDAMGTVTGRDGIQAALQLDRRSLSDGLNAPRKHPLAAATPPRLLKVPFGELSAALPKARVDEPFANSVPADFYYLRARRLPPFLDALDVVESWGQPVADYLDGKTFERATFERYLTELGLLRTSLARTFGPELVAGVAVTGSDPFIHEGTDLTLLFQVTRPEAFELALAGMLAKRGLGHGALTTSSFVHDGVTVSVARSADGRVRRHRASVNGVEVVSNSPAAIRRVISAALGRARRLADEPDFRYLLQRDASVPDDILAFIGDAFVARVASPAVRVAQSRRELAIAELSAPVYAALLYGIVNGRPPAGPPDLEWQGLLDAAALTHFDGAPIAFEGGATRSRWGTVAEPEPLIDGPEVTSLTDAELEGYLLFARYYEADWSTYVDPAMLRGARGRDGKLQLWLREVPILPRTARPLAEITGTARVATAPLQSGVRLAFGLGNGWLREEIAELSPRDSRKSDWIGHSVAVGAEDGDELSRVADAFFGEADPDATGGTDAAVDTLRDLPLYARLEITNPALAKRALEQSQMSFDRHARPRPWEDRPAYRGAFVTGVSFHLNERLPTIELAFAITPRALVVTSKPALLHHLIDEELAGRLPRGSPRPTAPASAHAAFDLAMRPDGGLATLIGRYVLSERVGHAAHSRVLADSLFRALPGTRTAEAEFRSASLRAFGLVPTTADGLPFRWSSSGAVDPIRGNRYAPIRGASQGRTPFDQVVSRLARFRSEFGVETEPGSRQKEPVQSFRAKMTLGLGN